MTRSTAAEIFSVFERLKNKNRMNQNEDTADLLSSLSDSVAIDYGVLTAIAWPADPTINATSGNNCTVRFKNGCSPREKLHFRFWPGNLFFYYYYYYSK